MPIYCENLKIIIHFQSKEWYLQRDGKEKKLG